MSTGGIMNIPSGHEHVDTSSISFGAADERWRIQTGNETGISIYTTSSATTWTNLNYTSLVGSEYNQNMVYRRPSAIRTPKKKKGDTSKANDPSKRLKVLPPVAIFHFVKKRFNLLEQKKLSARLERICQLLETAKACNQIALKDKINDKFGRFLREQEMIVCGFNQFIEKEDLQMFLDRCSTKIIKLTKLKNYIRIIPKNVRQRLEKAQKVKLFDEYLVLHTDPDDKSVEKTREEKKDPILFGVISESTRYYVVGDWIDEICDITMDKIMEALDLEKEETTLNEDVENALLKALF